jgi:hypothetical protein
MVKKDSDGIVCGLTFIGHAFNYNSVWMKEKTHSQSGVGLDIENETNSDRQQLHWGLKGRKIKSNCCTVPTFAWRD